MSCLFVEFSAPVVDEAWECEVTLVFQTNRELDEAARKAIERDYGMQDGCFKMQAREAMKEYCLAQLRISENEGGRPRHLDRIL